MKRWTFQNRRIFGAIAFVLVCLVGIGLVPWRIGKGSFLDATMRRLSIALGAQNASATDIRLTLLPTPRLTVIALDFAQTGGTIRGKSQQAVIFLKPMDLLRSQARPSGVLLIEPVLTLRLAPGDDTGFRRALVLLGQTTDTLANYKDRFSLRRVDVERGVVTIEKADGSASETISDVFLRARLPGVEQAFSLSIRGKSGGEEQRLNFRGSSPAGMASGKVEPIQFSYWSPQGSFEFSGEGAVTQNVTLKGAISGSAFPAALLRLPSVPGKPVAASLSANLDFSGRGANLADLKLSHGDDVFQGVASLRHDGQRWGISGTLATGKTDISGLAAPLTKLRKADGSWNDAPIDIETFFGVNLDLRISADSIGLFGQTLENAAVAVLVRPGKAELSLGDARYQRGTARFRATAMPGSFGMDLKISASLERSDIGSAIAEIMGVRRIAGIGNAALALETSGRTTAQFISNADGKFSANLRSGELVGIDLIKLAARRDLRPEIAIASALGGKTAVDSAVLSVKVTNGSATVLDSHMQSGRLVGSLQGAIDFSQALHDLMGSVVLLPAEGQQAEPTPVIDFSITGPLLEPRMRPVPVSQQKRS